MAKMSMGAAILLSVILGTVLISIFGISIIFSLIILGFIATYLTVSSQRSYKVGGIAGGILGIMIFIFGFFASPQLPNLPDLSGFQMIGLALGGLFTLILGFILSVLICVLFGSIGGIIAQKILKKPVEKSRKYQQRNMGQRGFKNKKHNKMPRRNLNRKKIN
jgi:hypothetical protein